MQPIGDILPKDANRKDIKPFTPIQERLLTPMDAPEEVRDILYQHSVLCQTCMPYRDPGDERICKRRNGIVRMEIQAGRALDPTTHDFVDVGLPWGPKARLVLYHLNAEALKQESRTIEVEDSLTAFVRHTLDLDPKGRNIRSVKDQLTRISPASRPRTSASAPPMRRATPSPSRTRSSRVSSSGRPAIPTRRCSGQPSSSFRTPTSRA